MFSLSVLAPPLGTELTPQAPLIRYCTYNGYNTWLLATHHELDFVFACTHSIAEINKMEWNGYKTKTRQSLLGANADKVNVNLR